MLLKDKLSQNDAVYILNQVNQLKYPRIQTKINE